MKHYIAPTVNLLYAGNDDVLTSSGGECDVWGDDIFAPLDE